MGDPMDLDNSPDPLPSESSSEGRKTEHEGLVGQHSKSAVEIDNLDEHFAFRHHFENGRRYANDDCIYPNDEEEATRLSIVHQVFLLSLEGKLSLSQIPVTAKRILDIGAGPGDWAIGMGERYGEAAVIAADITSYRPTNSPPNVTFQIDDAAKEWTYNEPFDMIHMRNLHGSFRDRSHIYRQAYKHLKPNGILEISDAGPFALGRMIGHSYVDVFYETCGKALEVAGLPRLYSHTERSQIEGARLQIVESVSIDIQLGELVDDVTKKRLGKMALVAALESVKALGLRLLTQQLGWSLDEVNDLCEKVKDELLNMDNNPYLKLEFVVARKLDV